MPQFSSVSKARLKLAHPLIQKVMNEAIKHYDFMILDSIRNKADQEKAFKAGHTKAHFGKSAHNYFPAIALDVAPYPLMWNKPLRFVELSKVILPIAEKMGVPLRWGADWDMDGSYTDESFRDFPHYELHPWREWAKKSKLFTGTPL